MGDHDKIVDYMQMIVEDTINKELERAQETLRERVARRLSILPTPGFTTKVNELPSRVKITLHKDERFYGSFEFNIELSVVVGTMDNNGSLGIKNKIVKIGTKGV